MVENIRLRNNQHSVYDTVIGDEVVASSGEFECLVKSVLSSNLRNGIDRCVNYSVSVSNYGSTVLSLNVYCGIRASDERLVVNINNPITVGCLLGTTRMISISGVQPKAAYGMPYVGYGSYKSFDYKPVYKTSLS